MVGEESENYEDDSEMAGSDATMESGIKKTHKYGQIE